MPVGSDSPAVHGSQPFLQAGVTASLTLLDHSLLHASFDRVHENISLFAAILVCGMPGGSRAMPSPHQGTLACPKPGTPGDSSPACDVDA